MNALGGTPSARQREIPGDAGLPLLGYSFDLLLLRYRWSVPDGDVMQQDSTSLPIPRDRLPVKLEAITA